MAWGMTFLDELQKMKEEMDWTWNNLFEKSPTREEQRVWQWVERLPKFEGPGRGSSKPRSNKKIKPF